MCTEKIQGSPLFVAPELTMTTHIQSFECLLLTLKLSQDNGEAGIATILGTGPGENLPPTEAEKRWVITFPSDNAEGAIPINRPKLPPCKARSYGSVLFLSGRLMRMVMSFVA